MTRVIPLKAFTPSELIIAYIPAILLEIQTAQSLKLFCSGQKNFINRTT